MECYNCGAYYDSNERMCPFCHSENPEHAVKEKQQMIETIQKEREAILQIPRKRVKWATSKMIKVGIVIFTFILIVVLGTALFSKLNTESKNSLIEENKKFLEQLYQEKDYKQLEEYMRSNGLTTYYYPKYGEMADIQYYINRFDEYVTYYEAESNTSNQMNVDNYCKWVVDFALRVISQCNSAINDNRFTGNEEVLSKFSITIINQLNEMFQLTKEEIDFILQMEWKDEEILSEYLTEKGIIGK